MREALMGTLYMLLSSRKFVAAGAGVIVGLLARVGLDVPLADVMAILSPLVAAIIGQGLADFRKEGSQIEAESSWWTDDFDDDGDDDEGEPSPPVAPTRPASAPRSNGTNPGIVPAMGVSTGADGGPAASWTGGPGVRRWGVILSIAIGLHGAATAQHIRYVENRSDAWIELPHVSTTPNPAWASMFKDGDFDRSSPPPAKTDNDHAADIKPSAHMLRPWTRIYWVEAGEPITIAPPHPGDPRWAAVDAFLLGDPRTRPDDARVDGFMSRLWRDEAGASDLDSIGAWSNHYTDDWYSWSSTKYKQVPPYLRVGNVPWADGVSSNGHYDQAVWCLEEYRRSGDPFAWQMFTKIVLAQAGQGIDWRTGAWRYEKTRWIWPGDFYPDGTIRWSHTFPAGVLLFWHLTGQIEDAATMIFRHMRETAGSASQARYNGFYGPRRVAWYLRALKCADLILGDAAMGEADKEARGVIDAVIARCVPARDGSGLIIPELQGQPNFRDLTVPYTAGTWSHWLFVSESVWWAIKWNDGARLNSIAEMARWLTTHTVNEAGQTAYTVRVLPETGGADSQFYRGATHTAIALPGMAALAAAERHDADLFAKSVRFVAGAVPYGILGNKTSIEGGRDRALGPASPKICADYAYGLRPWVLAPVMGR